MVVRAPTEVAYLVCTCRNLGTLQHTLCSGKVSMGCKIGPSLKYGEGYVHLRILSGESELGSLFLLFFFFYFFFFSLAYISLSSNLSSFSHLVFSSSSLFFYFIADVP